MLASTASESDLAFQREVEAGDVPASAFDHLAHLRLAYVYLCQGDLAQAQHKMRRALRSFLEANGIPAAKYHETLTRAWVMAVSHFMNRRSSPSFSAFVAHSQPLLDTQVMLTHYSAAALFSERARAAFVEPDLEAIPG
ncbi:hypothetical protein [Roseateles amylovorans]|uniref:Uncharacterized protein n=1 Tax=Roseateles amylovorans TaxID=2978473 RepID=A0ABY6B6B1_9BURK|nr:hypothetical protein [Roseateles amylovorans]UXH80709.1 hypothetical protein N4261_12865 [Roseateles amylovorans]